MDETTLFTSVSHVFEVKVEKNKENNEKVISKELLERCKKISGKYPLKQQI